MQHRRGFTLIELMITVAIIAILAAVAIPSYSEYVRRGKITDAISVLSGMRVKMEQHFQDNRSYSTACVAGSIAPAPDATANFSFVCTPLAATYLITANGIGTMSDFKYSINQANVRTTDSLPSSWTNPSSSCGWVIRRDGSC